MMMMIVVDIMLSIVYFILTERKVIYSFFSFSASETKKYMMPAVTMMEARMV